MKFVAASFLMELSRNSIGEGLDTDPSVFFLCYRKALRVDARSTLFICERWERS